MTGPACALQQIRRLILLSGVLFGVLWSNPLVAASAANATNATILPAQPSPAPIRFLLTFDDGPSAQQQDNPTEKILHVLEYNPHTPGIKAIFFVQTAAANGGGSEYGRALMRRAVATGHVLGFHTATPRHSNHRSLAPDQLEASLQSGMADLTAITGSAPELVRPPFWNFDASTLALYHQYHLQMLLTDLSANDGVIYLFNGSFRKRSNLRNMLQALRADWQAGLLPVVDGVCPIVVTFHDVNPHTAKHMQAYLSILLEVAQELEMPLSSPPFYDDAAALLRAAHQKTVSDAAAPVKLPGIWQWWWQ